MGLRLDGRWRFDPVLRALHRLHLTVSEPTVPALIVRGVGLGGGTAAASFREHALSDQIIRVVVRC